MDALIFLKIDVEFSELDVLQSLEKSDWGCIQNIVIEISLEQKSKQFCVDLLREQGFQTQVVQEPSMKVFQLGYLWGWRLSALPVMRSMAEVDFSAYHLPTYIADIKSELEKNSQIMRFPHT